MGSGFPSTRAAKTPRRASELVCVVLRHVSRAPVRATIDTLVPSNASDTDSPFFSENQWYFAPPRPPTSSGYQSPFIVTCEWRGERNTDVSAFAVTRKIVPAATTALAANRAVGLIRIVFYLSFRTIFCSFVANPTYFPNRTRTLASTGLCTVSRPSTVTVRPRPRCQRIETSCPR